MTVLLLEDLQTYLVAEGLVRDPAVAGDTTPLYLQPRNGVPAPGKGEGVELDNNLVMGAFLTGGIPTGPYVKGRRKRTVDIRYRAKKAPFAEEKDLLIREALHDKRAWQMGGRLVIETLQSREFQPLGSDDQSFDFVVTYLFEVYA